MSLADLFDHHLELPTGGAFAPTLLPARGGVYLIADRDDRPILLAGGEDLRRVVVHRLTRPPERQSKRADLSEVAARVHWRETFSRFETALEHWRAARVLYPQNYRRQLAFGPVWFLRLKLEEPVPAFAAVREVRRDGARYFGPVATRSAAEDWRAMLEDAFDLCRYQNILEQAPHGLPCAYFEMGKCPAPCSGRITLDDYRQMLAAAADFTSGDRQHRLDRLRRAMREAAAALEFERAEAVRQTLARTAAVTARPAYRHLADLSRCGWLIIQRGGPRRRAVDRMLVRPFFARGESIDGGPPVPLAELETAAAEWLRCCTDTLAAAPPPSGGEDSAHSEVLWLVGKFLFQGERAAGVFVRFDQLPSAETLAQWVRERLGRAVEEPLDPSGPDAAVDPPEAAAPPPD